MTHVIAMSMAHYTETLVIGSNVLIVLATIALTYWTMKAARAAEADMHADDTEVMKEILKAYPGRHRRDDAYVPSEFYENHGSE